MASGSVTVPPGEAAAPLNFIYACSVCCKTLGDVYEGHHETVEGFSDGINTRDRLVTHLYLASCCHVFCGSHLDGGAPNFHPEGQRPRAACPTCIKEKNDSTVRDLYSIRGFQKNEHDPMIPLAWFIAPPISFDGNGKEIEALRFQYLALVRYCQNTYALRKPLQNTLLETEKKLVAMQDLASKEHAKVLTLQQENENLAAVQRESNDLKAEVKRLQSIDREVEQYRRLDVNPKDLETFKNNKDAIRHYLKLIPTLIEQNDKMRTRLSSLGFAMALEPIPNLKGFDLELMNDEGGINGDYYGTSGTTLRTKATSSHTVGRSAPTSGDVAVAPPSPFIQRPLKRQRLDSPHPHHTQTEIPISRDAMPPPQKPMSRMRSVRNKIMPTLRKKFSGGRSTQATEYISHSSDDDGQWADARYDLASAGRGQTRKENRRDDTPYMTGALPIGTSSFYESPHESRMQSKIGVAKAGHEFTFRSSSPDKVIRRGDSHQPVQLPNEPSYIRLMDGLSANDGMELGLRDPRENIAGYGRGQHRSEDIDQENHRPGFNSQQQFSNGNYSRATRLDRTGRSYSRTRQESTRNPITPAPRKFQQPGHHIESVVSPHIKTSNRFTTNCSKPRIAETQGSSNRFVAYRSPNPRMIAPEPDWREPRGLNGLSFFESPVMSGAYQAPRHEPERQKINRPPPSRQYQSRNLTSRGFLVRSEAEQSPFFRDTAYGPSSSRPTYGRLHHAPSNAAIPFPSFNRSSYTRTCQPSSDKPAVMSLRSPVRTQSHWDALQRMGVRSSRHQSTNTAGTAYGGQTRNVFSSAGRRSIRR